MSVNASRSTPDAPRSARVPGSAWASLVVVAAILAGSGAVRAWQGGRVDRALERGRSSPFPLAGLPMTLGTWEGKDTPLDPTVVRVSGSTDLISRHYVDRRTGVGLDVFVLYGPASDMFGHTPEACYPAGGFEPLPGVFERSLALGEGGISVPFRSLAYTKGEGGLAESQEVYYSLWYDGRWNHAIGQPQGRFEDSRDVPGAGGPTARRTRATRRRQPVRAVPGRARRRDRGPGWPADARRRRRRARLEQKATTDGARPPRLRRPEGGAFRQEALP